MRKHKASTLVKTTRVKKQIIPSFPSDLCLTLPSFPSLAKGSLSPTFLLLSLLYSLVKTFNF